MTFGAHTVTHPILPQVSDEQAEFEIRGSWAWVSEEAQRPSLIFAFPNGRAGDFEEREISLLQSLELLGAVTSEPNYVRLNAGDDPMQCFRLPRFAFRDRLAQSLQCVWGIERAKAVLRGWITS